MNHSTRNTNTYNKSSWYSADFKLFKPWSSINSEIRGGVLTSTFKFKKKIAQGQQCYNVWYRYDTKSIVTLYRFKYHLNVNPEAIIGPQFWCRFLIRNVKGNNINITLSLKIHLQRSFLRWNVMKLHTIMLKLLKPSNNWSKKGWQVPHIGMQEETFYMKNKIIRAYLRCPFSFVTNIMVQGGVQIWY